MEENRPMERDEIIKALECCKSFRDFYMCDICPYYRLELADDESCTNRLSQDALSLIKGLEEELANRPHKLIITKKEKKNG